MEIFREHIFYSNCGKTMKPLIVVQDPVYSDEPIVELQKDFDENGEEIPDSEHEVVIGNIEYKHNSVLLRCSTSYCNRGFLHYSIEREGEVYFSETTPLFQSWWLKPEFESDKSYIPINIWKLFVEAIKCYNGKMWFSCGACLGGIIESICIEEKIKKELNDSERKKTLAKTIEIEAKIAELDKDDIVQKVSLEKDIKRIKAEKIIIPLETMINVLVSKKKLGDENLKLLHKIRNFRNDTIHGDEEELYIPSREELKSGIECIKHVFHDLYVRKRKGEKLNEDFTKIRNAEKARRTSRRR